MNIKKKLITFILTFAMVLSLIPILSVQAATTDYNIISDTEVTVEQARNWARSKGATDTFINLANLYFEYSSKCGGVNPAIAYVQSAKETGYGNFGGVIDESYHNPCGLKTSSGGGDTDKNAHQIFNSWDEGVQAHMDHLALYAGADGYPKDDTYDQRQFRTIKGKATTVNSLGGKWAPSPMYGEEINELYKSLLEFGDMGWKNENGTWYYYESDNTKATGWIQPDGNWYYLNISGGMATGWIIYQGDSYYLEPSTGRMVTNATVDGYDIGSDGKKQVSSNQSYVNNESTNNNSSNSKKTIVVDAGHDYGEDYGAEATFDGVTYSESDLNIQVAAKLKAELENRGYNVLMTRNADEKPTYGSLDASLTHKVNVANYTNADFFISIHHNSASETAQGVLTLYSETAQDDAFGGKLDSSRIEKSREMATLINNNIANKLGLNNRGAQSQNLFVCRNANMPAVLVEAGFITNKEEAIRCADSASQQKVAEAIAEVIAENIK